MRRIDPDTKGFKKELRKCVQIINQMTGVKAWSIKQSRPRDAAARRYSGRLWKNDHCAILLEEVHVGSMLERWIFTVARDEDSLRYKTPEVKEKEMTAAELKEHVVEQDGMVSLQGVTPCLYYESVDIEESRAQSVLSSLFHYYRLDSGMIRAKGTFLVGLLWDLDGTKQDKKQYWTKESFNLSRWLAMKHKTDCGFEEIWNEEPGEITNKKKTRWRQLVLKSLNEGLPVMCYYKRKIVKNGNEMWMKEWKLIVGCHESLDKVLFKSCLKEDGSESEEYANVDDLVESCMVMYVLVPGGGKKSHKAHPWRYENMK